MESVEILADMLDAVRLFCAAGTQWRWLAAGDRAIPTGMDYAGVRAAADWLGVTAGPDLLDDLRALEAGALEVLQEVRS